MKIKKCENYLENKIDVDEIRLEYLYKDFFT